MRRYNFTALLLIFALLCTLAACTAQPESVSPPESGSFCSPGSSGANGGASGAAGALAAPSAGSLRLCGTQADGGYYLAEDRGPYGNITYIDYGSRRQVYLCARPECAHDSDACTSVIRGSVLPFAANDRLYLMRVRTDGYGAPELLSMAPDGSDRKKLAQFPANYELDSGFYTDDTFLYLLADAWA